MQKLTDQQDSDRQYDPYSNEYARELLRQDTETGKDAGVNAGVDQAEAFANDPKNASAGIQAANQAEQVPNQYNWDETKNARSAQPKTIRARLAGFAKKRGATVAIGGGLLGFGTFLTIFLSPSLLLLQMADVLNTSFNDQLAALDARSTLIMKKKLNTQVTKGVCGTKITIKCKYRTISKNQTARLTAAGLEPIGNNGEVIEGRGKPTAFRHNGVEIPANQLLTEARGDPSLRSKLHKGYNPSFAAWADANAFKMLERFGIKKSSSVDPSGDKEKMRDQLKKVAQGNVDAFGNKKLIPKDSDGNVVDENSNNAAYFEVEGEETRYSPSDGRSINNLIQQSIDRGGLAESIGKTTLKNGVKSVLTSTALGAGAVDTLCTAWTLIRVAGFAAKIYQQQQLIRYAYEFQKQADMIRAGDGKAELSTFFNDIVTSTNANGKAATDSAGYLWAAFGDTFKPNSLGIAQEKYSEQEAEAQAAKIELQNETSRYVNGQLVSTSIMAQLAGKVSSGGGVPAADSTCQFVKSWKGQALIIGAAVAGAFVAIFSGGTSIGLGAVLNGAAGLTLSVAFALLQPKLIDMAKGEVIKGDENGHEAGNAIASGSGAINAQASQTRGLPVQTVEDHVAYSNFSKQVAADYAEVDRYERSPFDPTSKNTFLGSIMATIVPYVSKSHTVGAGVMNMSSLVLGTVSSFGVNKAGASEISAQQLSQCDDFEYNNIAPDGLAADPFCNLRYGMSQQDLAIDPERVVDYMLENENIVADDDPTAAPGSDYEDYIKKCIERETSIGDNQTSLSGSVGDGEAYDGAMCIDGNSGANEERNTMFRLFYIDTTVDEGMEGTFDVSTEQAITGGSQFVAATLNVRGYSHAMGNYKQRMDASIENLQSNNTDVAGLQEFQKPQREYFLKQVGSTFDISPKTADYDGHLGENPIIWNKTRFELVEDGVMPNLKYFDGSKLRVPWVKLKDINTQQEFYVLNTHDPSKPENAIYRFQNADQHVEYIKSLASEGLPIVFTGDFNSGYSVRTSANTTYQGKAENLTYCILTRDGVMNNTFDLQEKRDVKCPNPGNDNAVDHIYISPDIQLTKYWKTTKRGVNGNGSDSHDTHFADLTIPGGTVSSGAGSTFVIGTYNQKRSLSVAQHENAMDNIINKKMDVVGTQETSNPKFSRYEEYLGKRSYGVFPTALPKKVNQTCAGSQAIFYNKKKFDFVKGDFIQYPRYPGEAASCGAGETSKAGPSSENGLPDVWTNTPVVWLRDTITGQTVIVINTHGVANVELAKSIQPAKARYKSAQIYVENIKRLKSENPGVPIFLTGDFNEGTNVRTSGNTTFEGKQENLLFCMFAKENLMVSVAGPKMACDPKYSIGTVDYIYTSPEVKTDWVKEIASGGKDSGAPSYTDHPVRYAQVTVPGSGSGAASGGWVWPTIGPITNGNCYNVPVSGLGSHAGMDINTPVNNLKVVAMSDGVVVQKNYGSASGNYIMIKAADGTYYAYQHLKSLPTVTGVVKAGQEIGIAGKTGRVFLQSSQGHLHITMARTATLGSYGGHPNNFDPMEKLKAVKPANYTCTQ